VVVAPRNRDSVLYIRPISFASNPARRKPGPKSPRPPPTVVAFQRSVLFDQASPDTVIPRAPFPTLQGGVLKSWFRTGNSAWSVASVLLRISVALSLPAKP
jgi:hypothetical protein